MAVRLIAGMAPAMRFVLARNCLSVAPGPLPVSPATSLPQLAFAGSAASGRGDISPVEVAAAALAAFAATFTPLAIAAIAARRATAAAFEALLGLALSAWDLLARGLVDHLHG